MKKTAGTTTLAVLAPLSGVVAVNCNNTKTASNGPDGVLSMALTLPGGVSISSVSYIIHSAQPTGAPADKTGTIDTSNGMATPSVETSYPASTNDTVTLNATTSDGEPCTGTSSQFQVNSNGQALVSVDLTQRSAGRRRRLRSRQRHRRRQLGHLPRAHQLDGLAADDGPHGHDHGGLLGARRQRQRRPDLQVDGLARAYDGSFHVQHVGEHDVQLPGHRQLRPDDHGRRPPHANQLYRRADGQRRLRPPRQRHDRSGRAVRQRGGVHEPDV